KRTPCPNLALRRVLSLQLSLLPLARLGLSAGERPAGHFRAHSALDEEGRSPQQGCPASWRSGDLALRSRLLVPSACGKIIDWTVAGVALVDLGAAARMHGHLGETSPQGSTRANLANAKAAPIENLAFELLGKRGSRRRDECGKHFGECTLGPALGAIVDL